MTAIAHLETIVRFQDALTYTEPDDWHYPARHSAEAAKAVDADFRESWKDADIRLTASRF